MMFNAANDLQDHLNKLAVWPLSISYFKCWVNNRAYWLGRETCRKVSSRIQKLNFFLEIWSYDIAAEGQAESGSSHPCNCICTVFIVALFANGSNLHAAIHQYLSGKPEEEIVLLPANDGHWRSIASVLNNVTDVVCLEKFVRHTHLQYCGFLDCVAEYRSVYWSHCYAIHYLPVFTYDIL